MKYIIDQFTEDKEPAIRRFLEQMHTDSDNNPSKVIWKMIRGLPCYPMFQMEQSLIAYENGELVTFARLNSPWMGSIIIDNRSESQMLLTDMIRAAEENFFGSDHDQKYLIICVNEKKDDLKQLLLEQDYQEMIIQSGILSYDLNKLIPKTVLPEGFEVKTLQQVYDFNKLSKLLWEGFHYEGSVPRYQDEVYPPIKHAWSDYDRDICSVVMAPDGSYAAFAGFWYDKITQTGCLEPMVTDEKYRNQCLGKACVYNSCKILKSYGCKTIFVEPDEEPYPYYCKIGFEKQEYMKLYKRVWE